MTDQPPAPETMPDLSPSDRIIQMLMERLMDERGVHIETIYAVLGALAGFGCQMGIREALIKSGHMSEADAFTIVTTNDGELYYFGDLLNEPLLSSKQEDISVFNMILAATEAAGGKMFPDVGETVIRVADTCGTPEFYEINVAQDHLPQLGIVESLTKFWGPCREILESMAIEPLYWGWAAAQGAQHLIVQANKILEPEMAAKLVMETAIRAAKIDPKRVGAA